MRKVLHRYINGNYQVTLYDDGTKVRVSPDGEFKPKFPETIDVNISNQCPHQCPFCYISATPNGEHGSLFGAFRMLDVPKGVELALNYAEHPDLYDFLCSYKNELVINLTINSKSLSNPDTLLKIQHWLDNKLIHGLGISVNTDDDYTLPVSDNIVFHVIAGITPLSTIDLLVASQRKILILGYKPLGRAKPEIPDLTAYQSQLDAWLKANFGIISFDNLALEQLKVKDKVSTTVWEVHFMGQEGEFSLYIDTVMRSFSISSLSQAKVPLMKKNIKEVFAEVQQLVKLNN